MQRAGSKPWCCQRLPSPWAAEERGLVSPDVAVKGRKGDLETQVEVESSKREPVAREERK